MTQAGRKLIASAQEAVEVAKGNRMPARMHLIWTEMESSNIRRVSYDSAKQELVVQFRSGKAHLYEEVDAEVAQELFAAESPGSYFARNIRPVYQTYAVQVEAAPAEPESEDEDARPLSPRDLEND